MGSAEFLAGPFEASRPRLRAIAYRLLGSLADADDAVQSAWLKASQADLGDVENLVGWLTTVTVRVCMDQLRARRRRGEVLADGEVLAAVAPPAAGPEDEVLAAEEAGRALLVVLGRLSPAQRAAFVLHDLFAVPFEEIGQALGRSPDAAKKLASRARERLHGSPENAAPASTPPSAADLRVVQAFLSASRGGDLPALLGLLAPDVVRRVDRVLVPGHIPGEVRGARAVAEETRLFAAQARVGEVALVDGAPGIVIAPRGRLIAILRLSLRGGLITVIDVIGDPGRLAAVTVTLAAPSPVGQP